MVKNAADRPLSRADRKLFAACDALDPDGVRDALEHGANVNAVDPRYRLLPIDVVAEFALETRYAPYVRARVRRILLELLTHAACPDGAAGLLPDCGRETPLALFERDNPGSVCGEFLQCAGGHCRSVAERAAQAAADAPASTPEPIAHERL